jgi:hypothetical protein
MGYGDDKNIQCKDGMILKFKNVQKI